MTFLYRIYDEAGVLLYVGVASGLGYRFDEHQKKAWFPEAVTVRLERFASRDAALAAEKAAIIAESPRHNVTYVHAPYSDRLRPAQRKRKTHCCHGHAFDEANTYVSPQGVRSCRACVKLALERARLSLAFSSRQGVRG